jgi:hypothetical protein
MFTSRIRKLTSNLLRVNQIQKLPIIYHCDTTTTEDEPVSGEEEKEGTQDTKQETHTTIPN